MVKFSILHRLMKKMLPLRNNLLETRTKARGVLVALGMDYKCIHACKNDYVLF